MADLAYTNGFKAHGFAVFLGGTAALNLLVAVTVAFVAMRPGLRGALGVPAVLALLLALLFVFSSCILSENLAPHTASVLLVVCAFSNLIVTAIVTAASVFAERVGTHPYPDVQPSA
jgi:uncharacterized membrane protein